LVVGERQQRLGLTPAAPDVTTQLEAGVVTALQFDSGVKVEGSALEARLQVQKQAVLLVS